MLLIGIFSAVTVCLLAIDELRIRRLAKRVSQLERDVGAWKIAARHLADHNDRLSRELMS
ncbi:MAG TPA: hypothetical protein VF193_07495 [Steroidobacter sp.]